MEVAVVILNWNGRTLLERFLAGVVKHSAGMAQVYLADNDSSDDSIAWTREHFRESVSIVKNDVNGGYAKGYNDALKNIKADLYILLNSDVEVREGWLKPMITLFESNTKIAAAQPKIKDLKSTEYFEYAGASGGFLDRFGYPYCRGRIFDHCEKDEGQYDTTIDVQWASGACLFIRSDVYWEMDGLDEDFFAHQEEIDLCWRIKNAGYEIKASGKSQVFHLGGATLASANPQKTFYNFRNTLFAIVKNVKGPSYILLIFCRLLLDGIAGFKFLLSAKPKHMLAIVRAHFSFYRQFNKMYKKRKLGKQRSNYFHTNSIIGRYFLGNKRTFDAL